MKNGLKKYLICWILLVATFTVICLILPVKHGENFIFGYALAMAAFVGQLLCTFYAFKDSKEITFLNIPLVTISYTTLIISVVIATILFLIPSIPTWISGIISIIILVFFVITIIKANVAADIVGGVEKRVKEKTSFIKLLTSDAESLMLKARTEEAKKIARKVFEAIRYSDPMSNDALASTESQITIKFNEFENALMQDSQEIEKIANELIILINDRNNKCKILKK